ncbi:MAG TPA: DUF3090 domain-containing protein [Candidatus Limnocylindrales bacterium]|nr:DUF3090 domain-containing protein [Candidatus Limnocylindrales bacterium]
MARRIVIFDPPTRFVADAMGIPGERTFYLQARDADRIASVALEKAQVAVLAERMASLVAELLRRRVVDMTDPVADTEPLDEPLNEMFRVGALTLGWDADDDRVLVECREVTDDDEAAVQLPDDDPDGPDIVRVRITIDDARAFIERAVRIVAAGRPPCPYCGLPLEKTGHLCPRRNGHGSLVN